MTVPTLGVLGGMGPAATADFLAKLAKRTPAECDQDHPRTIVYSDPTTPDRSDAVLGQGASPLEAMLEGIAFLDQAGVDLIAVPCNTAHYWYSQLQDATNVPILHIVDAVNTQIAQEADEIQTVGLLATDGTVSSGIYHDVLGGHGRRVLTVDHDQRDNPVMAGIRAVKAGEMVTAREYLTSAMSDLAQLGAEGVVYGCTDVSAAMQPATDVPLRAWDSADALALACVEQLLIPTRTKEVSNAY